MKPKKMTMVEAYQVGKLGEWIIAKYGSWQNYYSAKVKEVYRILHG